MKKVIKKIFRPEFALFWLIGATLVFFAIAEPAFFGYSNLMLVLKNASYMSIMVLGVTWAIAIGETDVAFPDVAACASMVFAWLASNGVNMAVAILAALAAGALCGILTSFLVVKLKFNALITTIAVSVIAKSIAAAINGGMPLSCPVIKSTGLYHFINGDLFGIPVVFLISLVIYAILLLVQEKTRFGQYVYALGENRQAVKEAGVKSGVIMSSVFTLSSVFAALAGVIMVFVVYGSGQPKMGSSFFLDGLTVVFLGAMVLKLGKTNVVGTFLGGIMLAMIVNGLTMMGATFATSQIVKGILLVIGIVMAAMGQKKRKGKVGILKYE